MEQYVLKSALVAEIEKRLEERQDARDKAMWNDDCWSESNFCIRDTEDEELLAIINTLEVKDVDSMMHTIIAECCDWLAMNTDLNHNKIEGCRNLMLTVKDEQLKVQKGE